MTDLPDAQRHIRTVHGHRRAYLLAGPPLGTAPVLLLIHGIGDSSVSWEQAIPFLARRHTVLAPDLLGHGHTDKPRGDYSLGGFANGMRDLLALLGVESATVVGHSLGGGVALQFAYQYPEFCERLVLVASGGLGAEVTPLLRAGSLPGASIVLGLSARTVVRSPALLLAWSAARVGLLDPLDVEEVSRIWHGLRERPTRSAFLRTLRSVIDLRGQTVSSRDRLYLAEAVPTLVVWGGRDPILPVAHARAVVEHLPGARLEVVPRAGHQPHRSDPQRFAELVERFVAEQPAARHDPMAWRDALRTRDGVDEVLPRLVAPA